VLYVDSNGELSEERGFAGPIATVMDDEFYGRYHRVWKIDRSMITEHIVSWSAPDHVVPEAIMSWPGNGLLDNGEPIRIAPFVDLNSNDMYEPMLGEYPLIKGDQAVYAITHTESYIENVSQDHLPLPFDLHIMHYQYDGELYPSLKNVIFVNYQYINRSENIFTDLRFGQFIDPDIGYPFDDLVGCDSTISLIYGYNSVDTDSMYESEYDFNGTLPAVGLKFLNEPLRSHVSERIWSSAQQLDDLLFGTQSGLPFMDLGYPTNFQFPGGDFQDVVTGGLGTDRRSVGATGPFTLGPGDTLCMDLAFIYARAASGGAYASVEALKLRADSVQAAYEVFNTGCTSYPSMVGMTERLVAPTLQVYPNPSLGLVTVQSDEPQHELSVLDMQGRVLMQLQPQRAQVVLDLRGLSDGTYLLRTVSAGGTAVRTLVLER
jgi:hypothetical protein